MCLDLGTSRIGVAVSDLLGYTAQGVDTIQSKGLDADIRTIQELIKKHQVFRLIIGYPINMDGSEGNKAKTIREQYEAISAEVGIETLLWDERLSTKEAERALDMDQVHWKKKKQVIDRMAAQIILQSYLDYQSLKQ
ncbi:MAG: Holliday junction resolvase RuvX [Anaerofustis sp.]